MADPILFQSFPLADWPWGGASGSLCIFDTQQWTDQNGMVHLANLQESVAEPLQRCPIVVNGRIPVVQDFYYQPTVLSVDLKNVRRTGVVFDENDDFHYTLFHGWRFYDKPNPMTWTRFTVLNHDHCRPRMPDRYLDEAQILALLGDMTVISNGDLARLPTAAGTAVMVDGAVVVPSVAVTAQSLIKAWSLADGVSSALRVPRALSNVGADFTVLSSNDLDGGLIAWEIREPF